MERLYRFSFAILTVFLACALTVAAQETSSGGSQSKSGSPGSGFAAGLNLKVGAETFNELAPDGITHLAVGWQSLALQPDFSFGKFGVGLDVTLHYRFGGPAIYGQPAPQNFQIREADWVPSSFSDFLALYLPKVAYVRYAEKGDPLYVKLGSINDSTLGNGFIVGSYSNTLFLPETRVFGLNFDMDGSLFKFPYVGVQTFVANLTKFDLFGASLYGRPFLALNIPVIKNLQISGIFAMDRNPYLWTDPSLVPANASSASVTVFGADLTLPILSNPVVSLASMASFASENQHTGAMIGVAGRLVKFVTYGAQLRFLGSNFIPDYFGPSYDLYRVQEYQTITSSTTTSGSIGWFATAGFSALADKLVFNVNVDGPFAPPPTGSTNVADYPHLRAVFQLAQGVLPGLYFDASYDKKMITSFPDLISPANAVIGASVNYKTGPAVITLSYDLKYNPNSTTATKWTVNSGLSSSISLF